MATSATTDAVSAYFDRIAPLRVLDAVEVADLSKRVHAGRHAHRELGNLPDGHPARGRLSRLASDGDRARRLLVEHNLKLVPGVARRYLGHGLTMDALVQHGNVGLLKAVDRYDHTRGYRFATYAMWWIRQAIQRGVYAEGRAVRVPTAVVDLARAARAAEPAMRIELGRDPTVAELAAELDVEPDRLETARLATHTIDSLDRTVGADDGAGATVGQLLADPDADDPVETAATADLPRQAKLLLARLPERERWVLERHYGLDRRPAWSDQEIADAMGLSRQSAYAMRQRALQRLRHPANRRRTRRTVAA